MVHPSAPSLAAGQILGGRYRLDRLVGEDRAPTGTSLWRAQDLMLSRPVAVRTVTAGPEPARRALLEAAARSGRVHHPGVAATYDADEETVDGVPVAYAVREWVEGSTLRQEIGEGGDPRRLMPSLRAAAEGLAGLHAAGCWHGRLHPDNVIVVADGGVRLTDPTTAELLAAAGVDQRDGAGRPTDPPALPPGVAADLALPTAAMTVEDELDRLRIAQRRDTADLGRLLYAAATGTWVGGSWRGLPPAPSDGNRPRPARQVRAAVPRELDAVINQTLLPPNRLAGMHDAAAVAAALGRIGTVEREPDVIPPAPTTRSRPHPWTWRIVLLVVVVVLGITGYALGRSIGTVPGTAQPSFATSPSTAASGASAGAAITLAHVSAFDPPPGDGHENDDEVPLAYDGSTATAWQTERYSSADFGGLKTGVGLLVDLGAATHVSTVQLVLSGVTTVQLRAADAVGASAADYPVVTTATGTSITLRANATHRYWLVWLTVLPAAPGGYRGGVAELAFHS